MNLIKILLLLCFCLTVQSSITVYANDDYTQSPDYQAIMDYIRNNKFEQQPSQIIKQENTSSKNNTETYVQVTETKPQNSFSENIFETDNLNSEITHYNRIISKYNATINNYDNTELLSEYINIVEDYCNKYGRNSLKIKNINNYPLIMKHLGNAYEKLAHINEAIAIYESLLFEVPSDINIKKQLINLYDTTKSCPKVQSMLAQVNIYEPNYHPNLINCETNTKTPNFNNIKTNINSNPYPAKDNPVSSEYDWSNIYFIYFGIWVLILLCWLNANQTETNQQDYLNTYELKFENNKYPIKPDICEFGLNKEYSEQTFDTRAFWAAPISMFIMSYLFSAPNFIFPVFINGGGIILGLIFWIISANAVNSLLNASKHKKYQTYKDALTIYYQAKREYDNKLKLIEEQKRKEYERKQRLKKEYWYNLEPYKFEEQIGELCKNLGYKVIVTPKSNDGGIDVIIEKGNIRKGIQCKRYKGKVGAPAVQQLWGAKDYFKFNNKKLKIDVVIMVALSGVTTKAKEFINECSGYELWTIDTILSKAKEANYNYTKL